MKCLCKGIIQIISYPFFVAGIVTGLIFPAVEDGWDRADEIIRNRMRK